MNLTYRSIASILKYDKMLKKEGKAELKDTPKKEPEIKKGYYESEKRIVENVKRAVLNGRKIDSKFGVIECSLMDAADDIAYSTYDMEDAFKAGLLSPLDCLCFSDEKIEHIINKIDPDNKQNFTIQTIRNTIKRIFSFLIDKRIDYKKLDSTNDFIEALRYLNETSDNTSSNAYFRISFTSDLVSRFINGIKVNINKEIPALSSFYFDEKIKLEVKILKAIAHLSLIDSPKFELVATRGKEIIAKIFEVISKNPKLLPEDDKELYAKCKDDGEKARIISDFIAGMTDRYCVEFYSRITSENPQSIFKP